MKQITYLCAMVSIAFFTTLQCAQEVSDSVSCRIKQQEAMQQKLIEEIAQLAQNILRENEGDKTATFSCEEKKALEEEIKKLLENEQSRQRNHERSNSI